MLNVTSATQIFYDPVPTTTLILEDKQMVNLHITLFEAEYVEKIEKLTPWVLRIELDSKSIFR